MRRTPRGDGSHLATLWQMVRDLGVLKWLDGLRSSGRARLVGFSFHDSYDVFKEIIDAYPHWDMTQILYNYMSEDIQAGTKGLKYAASKGLGVVVMEPTAGPRRQSAGL